MFLDALKKIIKKQYNPLNIIEISKKKLISNFLYLSSIDTKIKIAPVLKSNAYGHGIKEVAKILDEQKPVFFCVDSIYEAYELFKLKVKTPILIMGYVDPNNLSIKKLPFSYAVFDLEQFYGILKYQPQSKVHLFIDSGMNREGIRVDNLKEFLNKLTDQEKNKIEGVMSHLASAENPQNADTIMQVNHFKKAIKILNDYSIFPKYIHLSNSAGILNNKKLNLSSFSNVSRTGLALYNSALQLKTHIIQIKKIIKGEKIGYDFTYQAKKNGKIAVLPIGYNDGLDRRLSNRGFVKINNFYCPIIGRVSMNLTVIDISSIKKIEVEEEVTVFSNYGKNSFVNSAKIIETIPYELLVHLDRSIKRTIVS